MRLSSSLHGSPRTVVYDPPPLHPGQATVLRKALAPDNRKLAIACGTNWGKTILLGELVTGLAWERPGFRSRIIAPVYRQVEISWRVFQALLEPTLALPPELRPTFRKGDRVLEYPKVRTREQRAYTEFRSGDDPDSLYGDRLDFVGIDEAAKCKEGVLDASETNTTATDGRIVAISTPKGRNFFFRMVCRGEDPTELEWDSYRAVTTENPYVRPELVEQRRRSMPESIFRQEYLAEFMDDEDLVFPGVERAYFDGENAEPKAGRLYAAGLDLGQAQNYTVLSVFDWETKREVFQLRVYRRPWPEIRRMILKVLLKFSPTLEMDATGVGKPIYEDLVRELREAKTKIAAVRRAQGDRVPTTIVTPFRFSQRSKAELVQNLQVMIENEEIHIMDKPETRAEYGNYSYEYRHKTGTLSYGPSPGYHDDIVDAHALAAWAMRRRPLKASRHGIYDDY